MWAWGYNGDGRLGDGTTTNRYTPVQVIGLSEVIAIAAGDAHSLALKTDGTVWAWGYNYYGELGDGTTTERDTPVQVSGLSSVVALNAGYWHSLVLKVDGTVWAWGDNYYGELGDGTTTNHHTPVAVINLSGVTAISVGGGSSMALLANGTVKAWGANYFGQIGNGTTTDSDIPVPVTGLSGVASIAANGLFSLALKADGTVWAWGYNGDGELGNGTTANSDIPIPVSGLSHVIAVAANADHALAIVTQIPTTVQVEDRTGNIQRPVALRATLTRTDNATPIAGKTLLFTLDGVSVGQATTDANGVATLVATVPQANGTGDSVIKAQFRGDTSFGPSSGQGALYVCPGLCNLAWTTPPWFQYGQIGETLLLSASLTNDLDNAPLPGRTLVFTLDGATIGMSQTDAHGIATLPLTLTERIGLGSKSLTVIFNGDRLYYSAPPQTVTLKIYKAIPDVDIDSVSGQAGQSVTLSAHLWRTRDHSPLAGRTLFFRVEGASIGSGITDASGTARLSYTIPVGMSSGIKSVTVAFLSDPFDYSALRTANALTVNP